MKRLIRHFLIDAFALYSANNIAQGLVFEGGLETFLLAAVALTIATLFGKPIINVLLLPLNLVTFGVFRWVSSAVALYLVSLVIKGFSIQVFIFEGITTKWIDLPPLQFSMPLMVYISFAFLISLITSLLHKFID